MQARCLQLFVVFLPCTITSPSWLILFGEGANQGSKRYCQRPAWCRTAGTIQWCPGWALKDQRGGQVAAGAELMEPRVLTPALPTHGGAVFRFFLDASQRVANHWVQESGENLQRVVILVLGYSEAQLIEPSHNLLLAHNGFSGTVHGHVGSWVYMLPERAHGCPGNLGLSTRHWVASGMRFGFSDLGNERHKKKGRGFAGAEKGEKKIQYRISLLIQAKWKVLIIKSQSN